MGYGFALQAYCLEGFDSLGFHHTTSRWTSGLGHHPFKVTRRVRFPYAIPITLCKHCWRCRRLVSVRMGFDSSTEHQTCRGSSLGRAPDCLSDSGGFDSRPRRQTNWVYCQPGQTARLGSERTQVQILPPRPV